MYREDITVAKACDGPAHSIGFQIGTEAADLKFVNHLHKHSQEDENSASCYIIVSCAASSLDVMRRCDNRSDKHVASLIISEKAVLQGVRLLELIPRVKLKVAFKKNGMSDEYIFSQAWTVPSSVLQLFRQLSSTKEHQSFGRR